MYGAILGDMIGAPYEFDQGDKTKDFPMFTEKSQFTDDTVMTIAVADALLGQIPRETDDMIRNDLIDAMHRWGRKYPNAGYGGRFRQWLKTESRNPYGSYGNGSAMRVAAAGWLYDDIETTRKIARLTADVTHNHPEGIKGAEATASAIFLARTGSTKEDIREYIIREFGYDLSRTCDEIRPGYHHVESCQETVPEAITAFLEGKDFDDVIRTAVSLGGDCDTLTCIAGSIAEAMYGVPALFEAQCKARLPDDMMKVLERFDHARGKETPQPDDDLGDNSDIEKAIDLYYADSKKETLIGVLEAIRKAMHRKNCVLIPINIKQESAPAIDLEKVKVGDTITIDEPVRFTLRRLQTNDGRKWLVAFTSRAEYEKGKSSSTMGENLKRMLKGCKEMQEDGIILNPWGKFFLLTKDLIRAILTVDKPKNHINFIVGDIAKLDVEVIVTAMNRYMLGGSVDDGAILRAAGPELLDERLKLKGCKVGEAKITGGYKLKAEYVIHTVGPQYKVIDPRCQELLAACYTNSLELAKQYDLHTIAFPAISTGPYGFPKREAATIAMRTISAWLSANPDYGMAVVMSCYDEGMRQYYQMAIDRWAPRKE